MATTDHPHESEPEKRAPGDLALVQRFVNTVDREVDPSDNELTSPGALVVWLADRGLCEPSDTASAEELARAITVREGLRAVLATHNGAQPHREAIAALERESPEVALRATFAGPRPELTPRCDGVDGALARLLATVTTAAADGSWNRLKACANDGCWWAFYDRSRNRSGRWCSMATCGNQQKVRAFRERARAHPGG